MKNIRKTIESAMREGLTLDEVCQIASIVAKNIELEQEKEDKVAEARMKLAEAFTDYINLVAGEEAISVEGAYDVIESNDELLFELFDCGVSGKEEEAEIEVIKLTEEDFSNMLKRLGF